MSNFQKVASEAAVGIFRVSANPESDPDWQRVHSYIADTIKDSYVLYAKLARLRGDFGGSELEELDTISAAVRDIGSNLSAFSEAFAAGNYSMAKKEPYGSEEMAMGGEPSSDFGEPVDFEVMGEEEFQEPEGEEEFQEPEDEDFEEPEEEPKKPKKESKKK